jgi:cytochrome c oxidase assembly protein subunit 11
MSYKNQTWVYVIVAVILSMFLLSYAAVPLYKIFCQAVGFAGTTKQVANSATILGEKTIKVRFDANVAQDLPWKFQPEQSEVDVKTGENKLIFYSAENLSDKPVQGMAVFNVTPHKAGMFFNKIHCFCFEEQTLQPRQKVTMPVSFYIDPKIETAEGMSDIDTITLSYSFFRVKGKK